MHLTLWSSDKQTKNVAQLPTSLSTEHLSRHKKLLQFAFSLQKTVRVPGQVSNIIIVWRVQVLERLESVCVQGIFKTQQRHRYQCRTQNLSHLIYITSLSVPYLTTVQ